MAWGGGRKRETLISGGLVLYTVHAQWGSTEGAETPHYCTAPIKVCKLHPENQFSFDFLCGFATLSHIHLYI